MEKLFELFISNLNKMQFTFQRYLLKEIDWNNRLIAIKGARGVGKTTLIYQYIKNNFEINESVLYVSLDNIYFAGNTLWELTDRFAKNGGKYLFLDEVHKYQNWAIEIKNIYDNYPELKIIFTGSSVLNIYHGFADLSRRAVSYTLHGLSFREYLEFEKNIIFSDCSLEDILSNHLIVSMDISSKIKPILDFKNYLKYGFYPYFRENKESYFNKLSNVINVVLENDLPSVNPIEYRNIYKLKKLLYIISNSVPFRVNISKLSESVDVSRNTIIQFLEYLNKAQIINYLNSASKGYGYLSKPEKIFLNNTNIIYALSQENANIGNLRETFFMNQLSVKHQVNFSIESDFLIDNCFTFEIGGQNKSTEQIKNLENAYIAKDNIENGYKNIIPLWLFGFLY
jgi:predicted AAA+ superfamily ATPase